MSVSSGKCDNCGADLTSEPVASALGGFDIACTFCGHRHHVRGEKKRERHVEIEARDPVPEPAPIKPHVSTPAPARAKVKPRTIWLIFAAIIGGTVAMIYSIHMVVEGSVYWEGAAPVVATVNGREIAIG
jgi:DNA-directed RNA polymerase subunit RPC12/RpoP